MEFADIGARRLATYRFVETSDGDPDYTTLLKILPPSTPQTKEIERFQYLLKPRLEAAQKEETAEMLGKLKGLGNSILGTSFENRLRHNP